MAELTMVQALNKAISDEMEKIPAYFVWVKILVIKMVDMVVPCSNQRFI